MTSFKSCFGARSRMGSTTLRWGTAFVFAVVTSGFMPAAQAQTPFYTGKTITVYCGYTPGGSYDLYARMMARFIGKHIPGHPAVVVQNMPGAGSLKAANFLYEAAPKDGTALGVIVESHALEQAIKNKVVRYDASKFTYIGRAASSNNVFLVWHTSPVQSFEEAKHKEVTTASTGPGSIAETVPQLTNALLGTKFKIITGYPASTEGMMAMERGETNGASTSWTAVKVTKQDWLREKKIKVILQTAPERAADLPDAPSLGEIGKTEEDKQVFALYSSGSAVGRSLMGPPNIPADRVALLRKAFMEMVKDPDFLAEAKKVNVDVEPLPGETVEALIKKTLAIPDSVRQRAESAFGRAAGK